MFFCVLLFQKFTLDLTASIQHNEAYSQDRVFCSPSADRMRFSSALNEKTQLKMAEKTTKPPAIKE